MLALIVAVPVSAINLAVGSRLGIVATDYQPMKIASTEALWDTEQPAAFSLFQIGGFSEDDQTPSFDIEVPRLLSILATGTLDGEVQGITELQRQYEQQYGPGNYIPPVRTAYWAMRIMAYLGTLVFLVVALGAVLYRRATTRAHALVPMARGGLDRASVPRRTLGLGADRGGTAAVDRAGPAENSGRQLAERQHRDDRHEHRRVRHVVRGARHRRFRAHATVRAARSTRIER